MVVSYKGKGVFLPGLSASVYTSVTRKSGVLDNLGSEGYLKGLITKAEMVGPELTPFQQQQRDEAFNALKWLSSFMLAEFSSGQANQKNFDRVIMRTDKKGLKEKWGDANRRRRDMINAWEQGEEIRIIYGEDVKKDEEKDE